MSFPLPWVRALGEYIFSLRLRFSRRNRRRRVADGKAQRFLFEKSGRTAKRKTQSIAKRVAPLKIDTGEELIFLRFAFAPVTADEIAALSRWKSAKKKTVFCGEMEESAKRLCQRLGIRVQTGESVYQTLKECDGLPSEYLGEELPVDKKIRRKTTCFAKRNGGFGNQKPWRRK